DIFWYYSIYNVYIQERTTKEGGFKLILPKGLIGMLTKDKWIFHRRLLSPLFSERFLKLYSIEINKETENLLNIYKENCDENGIETNMHEDLTRLTLDIIGRCIFGMDFKSLEKKEENNYLKASEDILKFTATSIWVPKVIRNL